MKVSETMKPFAALPDEAGWISHRAEHVANIRAAIPLAQAMERVVEEAGRIGMRLYTDASHKDLLEALKQYESLQPPTKDAHG